MLTPRQIKNIQRLSISLTLLCFMFWAWSQKRPAPEAPASAELLERARQALAEGKDSLSIALCDRTIPLLQDSAQRTKWYGAIRLRTIAQVNAGDASLALIYLLPLLQKQTQDDSISAKLYGLAGYACLYMNDHEQGSWYYEQNLAGLRRHHCQSGIGTAYMNLGFALKLQGDFRAAQQYYRTALPLLRQEGNTSNLSESCNNLGDISRYLFEFDTARAYYRQMAQADPTRKADLAAGLGWADADERRYPEALAHFRESCRLAPATADVARIMGHCAEALGDTAEADRQFLLALKVAETASDSGSARWYIGNAFLQRRQPEAALAAFQQGLHDFFPSLSPDDPTDNPRTRLPADFWPAQLLRDKAKAFRALYAQTGDARNLHHALSAATTAMAALDTLRTGMRNETSGQDAVDYAYDTYEIGIRVALELERAETGHVQVSTAYEIAEHAKSNVLKANLLEKDLRQNAQIPDSLLWQEKTAGAAVAYWEAAGRPDSLLAAVRRLESIRSGIEKHLPLLRKARAQTQTLPIATLQDALGEGELLLQYFWGDSAVVAFAIGKHAVNTRIIPRTAALDQSIDTLRTALTNWHLSPDAYAACAAPVYRQFCAPLLEVAGKVDRLIIVPDGPLWAVPFEALCKDANGRFLVQDYAISYHWSGALWLQARAQGRLATADYGGFAPQYPAISGPMATLGAGLGDLPEARAAVAAAGAAWGGQVWQGPAVDKALFQREAGKYGILHLAMHGLLDLKDRTRTGLVFPGPGGQPDLLNTLEISQMDLSAQLAVLSACNTGSGVVFRGEGVMSLSRAFALAGCPALTANLWEVPSRETNDITAAFLTLLKSGQPKDAALRAAKLDYLGQAESERRHPFFWAGQVLIGNEQPIRRSPGWWWVLGLAVLGGLGWLGWRRWGKSVHLDFARTTSRPST